jgi:eukaryotic translation initiation factor 2C
VTAVGVKRPGFGTAGRVIKVRMNSFEATVANDVLYQYDGKVSPSEILTLLTLANPSLITVGMVVSSPACDVDVLLSP